MTSFVDPIEQRDPWCTLWQLFTGDGLITTLTAIVMLGLLATLVLPQSPSAGTADPIAYSQWEAFARLREGVLYEPLAGLGLSSVFQTVWWRLALAALGVLALARLIDRFGRLLTVRLAKDALTDESRRRVFLDGPALSVLADRLRVHHLRVTALNAERLIADRWPRAEAASAVLHTGIVLAVIGMLMNILLGWDVSNRALVPSVPVTLHGTTTLALDDTPEPAGQALGLSATLQPSSATVTLVPNSPASASGISLRLKQVTPGYRVSASKPNGQALLIRASNFVSPTAQVLVIFTEQEPDRYLAVPDARLALALSPGVGVGGTPDAPARVQAFALPSGTIITDTLIAPEIVVSDTRFSFARARGAVIDADYRPGNVLVWIGLPLALIGLIGSAVFPMQRIVVRHQGHWTEFYASGRGIRRLIHELVE